MFCYICLEEVCGECPKYLVINQKKGITFEVNGPKGTYEISSKNEITIARICFTCDTGSIYSSYNLYDYKHLFRKDAEVMFMTNVLSEAEEYIQKYKELSYLE